MVWDNCERAPLNNDTKPFKRIEENLQTTSKTAEVDEFFFAIGQFGRGQKLLCFLLYLLEIPHSYATMYWFFTGHSPPWKCSFKSNETVLQCNRTGTFDVGHPYYNSRCSMNRESWDYVQPSTYSIVTEVSESGKNNQVFNNVVLLQKDLIDLISNCTCCI